MIATLAGKVSVVFSCNGEIEQGILLSGCYSAGAGFIKYSNNLRKKHVCKRYHVNKLLVKRFIKW